MKTRKFAAICLTVGAAFGAAGAGPAFAEDGSVPVDGPGACDVVVWWDSEGNPIAGATVPNPVHCVRPFIGTGG